MMNTFLAPSRFANSTLTPPAIPLASQEKPALKDAVIRSISVEEELFDIYNAMESAHAAKNQRAFENSLVRLRRFIKNEFYQKQLGAVFLEKFPNLLKEIRLLYQQFALKMETLEVEELTRNKSYSVNYLKSINDFADMEMKVSGINASSKVVFVGSGPNPYSALNYIKVSNSVDAIETSQQAVDLSRKYLNSISGDLAGKLKIFQADPQSLDYGVYSHIFVSAITPDRQAVINQIKKTAKPNTIVVVRAGDGLRSLLYESLDHTDLSGLNRLGKVYGDQSCNVHAVLYQLPKKQ